MTEPTSQEIDAHIAFVEQKTIEQIRPKYLKGQAEHGGKLWLKNIIPLIKDEVTDFNVYLPTLIEQVEKLVLAAEKAVRGEGIEDLHEALAPFHFKPEDGDD